MAIGIPAWSKPIPSTTPPLASGSKVSAAPSQTAPAGDRYQGQAPESSGGSASNMLSGLMGSFAPKLSLTPEQLEQMKEASPTLQKLAGADGKWGPSDLADNVQAVGGRFLQRTVVEGQLRKGFEEMTGKPVAKLTPEEKEAAKKRWDSMSAQQQKDSHIQVDDLRGVKTAMDSVKASTALTQIAPKSDGISGNMLQRLTDVKNPTVMDLMEAQKPPADPGESAPPAAAPEATAPAADSAPPPPQPEPSAG